MQGFFLGLANGTSCLALCAPVLVPLLLSEGHSVGKNLRTLAKFLGGRLGGYLLFALLAWTLGGVLKGLGKYEALVVGGTYVGLSLLLLTGVFRKTGPRSHSCAVTEVHARLRRWPSLVPVGMGLLAGLKVCPPVLLALTGAASRGTLAGSLLFFVTFFMGTSLYFLPISLLGAFAHAPDVRLVGKFAAVIVALYYLFSGALLFAGGV
jgi:hypothetical protein